MNNKKNSLGKVIFSIFCILIAISILSCSKESEKKSQNENIKITATFYPLYIMLLNITDGMDDVELSLLAPSDTGCLHDYQLTTRDMNSISNCDIIVINGSGMEDFADKALEIKKDSTIIASRGYELFDGNAHIWVSPSGAIHQVQIITEDLARMDPKRASQYKKNGEVYIEKLESLKTQMHESLDKYKNEKIITFHEAFPYFAAEFGFEIVAIIEREPGTEPSPKELIEVIDIIKETKKANSKIAIFAETQYSSTSAQVIASETGCIIRELDPAVNGVISKDSYIITMKRNTEVLVKSFS